MRLTKTEENLMNIIWKNKKIFLKEILDLHALPKPAPSTIATLLKRMQEKGFVAYNLYGNSRQYYPLIKKSVYFTKNYTELIKDYFQNSPLQFASFFTTSSSLTLEELEELKKIINQEILKKKK